jgi:hypothetical protein
MIGLEAERDATTAPIAPASGRLRVDRADERPQDAGVFGKNVLLIVKYRAMSIVSQSCMTSPGLFGKSRPVIASQ